MLGNKQLSWDRCYLPYDTTECGCCFTPSYSSTSLRSSIRAAPRTIVIIGIKQSKKREREIGTHLYVPQNYHLGEMLLKHKLTSVLTEHWAFLQHYSYHHLKNILHIWKRWKLLGKWKMSAHTEVGSIWKPLFPRTAGINKKDGSFASPWKDLLLKQQWNILCQRKRDACFTLQHRAQTNSSPSTPGNVVTTTWKLETPSNACGFFTEHCFI